MFVSGFSVTVFRTERDAFGDPQASSGFSVPDCGLLQHATSEDTSGGEQVSETATLATTSTEVDIRPSDAVLFPDGSRWQVSGRAYVPHSPLSGWEPAQVVPLKRVTG